MNTRVVVIVGSVVGALLVAVVVVLVLLLNQMNAQADQQRYEDCMARQGFAVDEKLPAMSDEADVDAWINGMGAAAESCID